MYSDNNREHKRGWLWVLALVLVMAMCIAAFSGRPGRDLSESSAAAIRAAVQRSALQCYVVEGVYPPNLQYLEENYGLQVNHEDFYVTYDAFASNLPPTVKVTRRLAQPVS